MEATALPTECSEGEVSLKAMHQDPIEDPIRINGDMNGSYDEEMEVCEDVAQKSPLEPSESNGEVVETKDEPSQENGVEEAMDVDSEPVSEIVEECASNTDKDLIQEVENNASDSVVEEASLPCDGDSPSGPTDNCAAEDEQSESAPEPEVKEISVSSSSVTITPVVVRDKSQSEESDIKVPKSEVDDRDSSDIINETENRPSSLEISNEPPKATCETETPVKRSLEITLVPKPGPVPAVKSASLDANSDEKKGNHEVIDLNTPEKMTIDDDDSCIEVTPDKLKKKKSQPLIITPRRSSRNLNKTKSYEKDIYIDELDRRSDDDVEEVIPTDPLADDTRKPPKKTTIVVSDTKKLVEIAAGSKSNKSGKKEPTLVIIDTNSILSGKGPIPVTQTSLPQMTITPTPRSGYSMVPVQQNMFHPPTKVKVTPTPIPTPVPPLAHAHPKPTVLPSLTDDMYVVEAPSFIVPYVYEKPPVTALKEYVDDMEKTIKEQIKQQEKEEKLKRKKEKEAEKAAKIKEEAKEAEEEKLGEDDPKSNEEEKADKKDVVLKIKEEEEEDVKDIPIDDQEGEEKLNEKVKDKSSDTETDDEDKDSDSSSKKDSDSIELGQDKTKKKSESYFDNPIGKFFMQIGVNLVQEHVQTDLLRNQKRKRDRDGKNCSAEVHMAINSLLRTLEFSKENNEPFKLEMKKCSLCSFKTESDLVMAHHLETPHMRSFVYRCNFCSVEVRSPHDILFHMEAEHNVRGRLERAPALHQCPNCPFEDNQKGKLSRHLLSCAKKYKPERNQEPPLDWEPPAKIPRVRGGRPTGLGAGAFYQPTLAPRGPVPPVGRMPSPVTPPASLLVPPRVRGRPPVSFNRYIGELRGAATPKAMPQIRPNMMFGQSRGNSQGQVLLPSSFNSLYQGKQSNSVNSAAGATAKLLQQPSISITPLPRNPSTPPNNSPAIPPAMAKPGRPQGSSKATFVICEICDGYIKDLEQLRNHMQWIHKVKIHPKMIYNRPPLNCQKCQFRFFTDQGLERHLLGSHGLVTSSMQEAANKGKDGGRCPVCGRVYQWKLLNHVARDHNMSLKPAHLSYKCTVCTATFGMYKQFESHVYSAHSVVAKRVSDKKPSQSQPSTSNSQSDTLLKPLKINDEITIIPQPARAKTKPSALPQKPNKV